MDENVLFRKATLQICSSLNFDTALRRCINYLEQHIPISGVVIGLYEPDLNVGRILTSIWPVHWEKIPDTIPFPRELWEWAKENWTGDPSISIINDIEEADTNTRQILSTIWPGEVSNLGMDLESERRSSPMRSI